MFEKIKKLSKTGLAGTALVAGAAFAQTGTGVDVSAVTSSITNAATAGATVGLAILVMHYGIKLYKWVRQAG